MTKKADLLDALFAVARQEAQKRRQSDRWHDKAAHLRSLLMAAQALLERDEARRISVGSPRQTGKSTAVLLIVLIRCLEKAAADWVIVGLTRPSIKGIYWIPLKRLNKDFELGFTWHNQELTATLPNGSRIRFVGADNVGEIEKLRGGRYDGVVIDECKSFPAHLFRELVHDIIEPALMAKVGQLFIIGTPGDELGGPFYEATADEPVVYRDDRGEPTHQSYRLYGTECSLPYIWSCHKWTMRDNTTVFETKNGVPYTMWDQALAIKKRNLWDDNNPTWLREYMGRWVPNDNKRVYRYVPSRHDYTPLADTRFGLPEAKHGYRTVIGVDFGTRDGTAIVVWAWNEFNRELWEVYSEVRRRSKGDRLVLREIAEWYKEVEAEYGPFDGWPADPAGLATMVMDTLADDYEVFLEPAEKKEKLDHIELFNNDLDAGLVRIRRGSALSEELLAGRWNAARAEKGKREEDPAIPNDCTDAGLYAFRWCNHRRPKRDIQTSAMFSTQWWHEQAARELSDARKRARDKAVDTETLDREWWS